MPHVDRNAPDVTQPVSQEEREWIRFAHVPYLSESWPEKGNLCLECSWLEDGQFIPYPCPTIRALDALEAAERERDALVAAQSQFIDALRSGAIANATMRERMNLLDAVARSAQRLRDIPAEEDGWGELWYELGDDLDALAAHDARRNGADHE